MTRLHSHPCSRRGELSIKILKLITGEELIAVVAKGAGFEEGKTFVTAPVLVERGGLGGRWITGLNVNNEPSDQPIPDNHILLTVKEEDIQPILVERYRKRFGLEIQDSQPTGRKMA